MKSHLDGTRKFYSSNLEASRILLFIWSLHLCVCCWSFCPVKVGSQWPADDMYSLFLCQLISRSNDGDGARISHQKLKMLAMYSRTLSIYCYITFTDTHFWRSQFPSVSPFFESCPYLSHVFTNFPTWAVFKTPVGWWFVELYYPTYWCILRVSSESNRGFPISTNQDSMEWFRLERLGCWSSTAHLQQLDSQPHQVPRPWAAGRCWCAPPTACGMSWLARRGVGVNGEEKYGAKKGRVLVEKNGFLFLANVGVNTPKPWFDFFSNWDHRCPFPVGWLV